MAKGYFRSRREGMVASESMRGNENWLIAEK